MSLKSVYRVGVWFRFVRFALLLAVIFCWDDRCFDSWVLLALVCLLRVTHNRSHVICPPCTVSSQLYRCTYRPSHRCMHTSVHARRRRASRRAIHVEALYTCVRMVVDWFILVQVKYGYRGPSLKKTTQSYKTSPQHQ